MIKKIHLYYFTRELPNFTMKQFEADSTIQKCLVPGNK